MYASLAVLVILKLCRIRGFRLRVLSLKEDYLAFSLIFLSSLVTLLILNRLKGFKEERLLVKVINLMFFTLVITFSVNYLVLFYFRFEISLIPITLIVLG